MGKKHGKKEMDASSWTLETGKCNLYCPPQPQRNSAILKPPPLVAYLPTFTASVPLLWSQFSSKDPQMLPPPLLLLLLQTTTLVVNSTSTSLSPSLSFGWDNGGCSSRGWGLLPLIIISKQSLHPWKEKAESQLKNAKARTLVATTFFFFCPNRGHPEAASCPFNY